MRADLYECSAIIKEVQSEATITGKLKKLNSFQLHIVDLRAQQINPEIFDCKI